MPREREREEGGGRRANGRDPRDRGRRRGREDAGRAERAKAGRSPARREREEAAAGPTGKAGERRSRVGTVQKSGRKFFLQKLGCYISTDVEVLRTASADEPARSSCD